MDGRPRHAQRRSYGDAYLRIADIAPASDPALAEPLASSVSGSSNSPELTTRARALAGASKCSDYTRHSQPAVP